MATDLAYVSPDLLNRVRADMIASGEPVSIFADMNDEWIADEMADATGRYENDTPEAHVAAIALVRAEYAKEQTA